MTREEAREIIEIIDKVYCTLDKEERQALAVAIQALEQEPILDKLRAELIQSIQNGVIKIEDGNEELFRIIDKYKTESEEV